MARTKGLQSLRDVKLDEISFVGKGDNPEAHIVLLKNKPVTLKQIEKTFRNKKQVEIFKIWCENNPNIVTKDEAKTFGEIVADKEVRDKIWSMIYTLEDSIYSIMYDEECEDKKGTIQQSVDEFKSAVTQLTKGETDMPAELKKQLDEANEKIETLTKENETLKAAKAKSDEEKKKMEEEMAAHMKKEEEKIDKSVLPENVRKQLEEIEKKAEDDRKEIAKLRDAEVTREYIGKAAELQTIGKVDEIGSILKSVASTDSALAGKVFDLLKAADVKIREGGLFKENGIHDSNSTGVTAHDKILAKAAELRKSKPELSAAKAYTQIYDTDHELREQYLKERNGQ